MDSVTYVSLGLGVIALLWVVLRGYMQESWQTYRVLLIHLFLLTLVFDSLIIAAGIVAYDEAKLLGIHLSVAPIEDFLYAVAAVFVIPALWRLSGRKRRDATTH